MPKLGGGAGGLLRLFVDVADILELANRGHGDMAKVGRATAAAHEDLAKILQGYIAKELEDRIEAHGRVQSRANLLIKKIGDPQNRRVRPEGFSVGFLDEQWSGEVRKYYRGLEIGTSVHVGRFLRGGFLSAATGDLVGPEEGGKDGRFIQFKNPKGPLLSDQTFVSREGNGGRRGKRVPVVRIKNRIKPYHYTRTGFQNFENAGYLGDRAMGIYNDAFAQAGMSLRIRNRNRGGVFSPGSIGFGSAGLNASPIPKERGR